MTDYFDLTQSLNDALSKAYDELDEAETWGTEAAQMRAGYKAALATKILELRAKGTVPATLIQKVAEGSENVRTMGMEMEIAEVRYKASLEAIQLHKREADIIREQINREGYVPRRENL